MDSIIIKDLHVQAVIGVNANERNIKQNIIMTIKIYKDLSTCGSSDLVGDTISYSTLSKSIQAYVESSHHYTLEALATGVARTCCLGFGIERVKVLVEKPGAVKLAKWPGVKIERTLEYFRKNHQISIPTTITAPINNNNNTNNIVYLSIGSNLGDKYQNILQALDLVKQFAILQTTSFLYETDPAYFTEQPTFFNICCRISTALNPHDLLSHLKDIEKKMGRVDTFRNGPRIIDLDIVYYNNIVLKTDNLEIPHKLMWERDFVLVPLSDIAPDFIHPSLHITTNQMKINLKTGEKGIKRILRIGSQHNWEMTKKTFIMGILNVTPDSFADGGQFNSVEGAFHQFEKLVKDGADIIDIGGQSTYPGAVQISVEEELARVIPVIKRIRDSYPHFPLSIDTYHSQVAKKAIEAGCNVINDISGGLRDPHIINVALQTRSPIIINHEAPTPQFLQYQTMKMNNNNNQGVISIDHANPNVIDIVGRFFEERIETLVKCGLYLWQIILDPGLGFSKTYEQSIELIKRGKQLMHHKKFPLLIGPSRKGFIGATLAKCEQSSVVPDAKSDRRLFGTAACCCISAGWGVTMVRVHDVREIKDTILIADTIYKQD